MNYLAFLVFVLISLTSFGQHTNRSGSTTTPSEDGLLSYIQSNTPQSSIQGLEVNQTGNLNAATIRGENLKLNQSGYNQQFYFNETSMVPSNMNINIEGVNSYVEIMGSNRILNNATINIKGDSRSVIIRNYR